MNWPMVPLGEVLQPVSRPEAVEPESEYKLLGAHWYAKGLYIKDTKAGSGIQAKWVYRVEEGDFVYNRLFAWMGSFAVASAAVHNCYVSNEFPCFSVNKERAIGGYLWHYFSRQSAWSEALGLSSGGTPTSRNRLKEEKLLGMAIPLPPVEEQRRIVARVDAIASRTTEARRLREEADSATESLFSSVLNGCWRNSANWNREALGTLVETVSGQVDPRVPPYSDLPLISGDSIQSATCRLLPQYRTAAQDEAISGKFHFPPQTILYSKIRPYLRKATLVPFEALCSADIYAFSRIDEALEPRFLMYALVSGEFTDYANRVSGRTRMPKLNQAQLFAYRLPYPPLDEQRRIVAHLDALQAKLEAVRAEQRATAAELDALLPSVLNRAFAGQL